MFNDGVLIVSFYSNPASLVRINHSLSFHASNQLTPCLAAYPRLVAHSAAARSNVCAHLLARRAEERLSPVAVTQRVTAANGSSLIYGGGTVEG